MLTRITPVILTYNEAPNIARTLAQLAWAERIVAVDSYSTDETAEILSRFPRVDLYRREFDTHADQWNYALKETGITTEWVLALDADYVLTDELVAELEQLDPPAGVAGYRARFRYCIAGHSLRGSVYPPVTVLYRRHGASYLADGHTQRISVAGSVGSLASFILHDDRKPLSHWVRSQDRYMRLEARQLREKRFRDLGWADRLRTMRFIAPPAMLVYCLMVKGAILDGRAGLYYGMQRMFAEMLLSLYLIQHDLGLGEDAGPGQELD